MTIIYNYLKLNDRYAQLYRLQELLQDEHNFQALTNINFKVWEENTFEPMSELISLEIVKLRALIKKDNTITTSLTDVII